MLLKTWLPVLLFLAGSLMIYNARHCLFMRMSGLPEQVQAMQNQIDVHGVALLYGDSLCNVCPSGQSVLAVDDPAVAFILEAGTSDYEIENFATAFQIQGQIARGDEQAERYLKRLARCRGFASWRQNVYLILGEDGKVLETKVF